VLEKGEVVQVVVDNLDPGRHPFHLHGHNFQAIYRSEPDAGTFAEANIAESDFPRTPMKRDTLVVWPNGNIVLRFRADNPGVWLFHCHIEWHVASGLVATFVEAPLDLQNSLTIPNDHLDACTVGGYQTKGNAAGNTENLLDLTGENVPPGRLPDGFTPRGIVALVFSCIAGILGLIVVAWYGTANTGEDPPAGAKQGIAETRVETTTGRNTGHPSEEITAPTDSNSRSGITR
jgi:iron transport multicopper oxidase